MIDKTFSYRNSLLRELERLGIITTNFYDSTYKINPQYYIPETLGYEDVAITQNENVVDSRLDVDISTEFVRGLYLDVPLMSANMSTVTDAYFANAMHCSGALGVLHRAFRTRSNYLLEASGLKGKYKAVSVGVGDDQVELAKDLIRIGADIIFIDVAHGYSGAVVGTAEGIKDFDPQVKLVVGNTINPEFISKVDHVADAVKVGIAQGLACETRFTAGCTEKQFSAVLKFRDRAKEYGMPIIADGGIRQPSDFVKAIAAGANSVMAGSIFAACCDSPAPYMVDTNRKLYAGMASEYVQSKWKGGLKEGTCSEGKVVYLDVQGKSHELINRYAGALRSGITYGGGYDIRSFQERVNFVRV